MRLCVYVSVISEELNPPEASSLLGASLLLYEAVAQALAAWTLINGHFALNECSVQMHDSINGAQARTIKTIYLK